MLLTMGSCANSGIRITDLKETGMASGAGLEHNKQLVHRIAEEMFNKGKLDVAPEIFAPDFVDRGHESMAGKAGPRGTPKTGHRWTPEKRPTG